MNHMLQTLHPIRLRAPFYGDGEHTAIHRYLDTEFINRFRQDVASQRFHLSQFSSWLQEERHSRHDNKPVLRLPTHRAFHVVCCEVNCDRLGQPALDPRRIRSAGFVIRRVSGGREQAWVLEDGEARGWEDAPTELRDPDLHRRLCANGIVHARAEVPAYSGEDVHPMHVLTTRDAQGKAHTLLYGFLPLGGFYYARDPRAVVAASASAATAEAAAALLPWPYGFRDGKSPLWRNEHSRPVDRGRPSPAFAELLRQLVNRYHLGETGIADNHALEKLADQLGFVDEDSLPAALRTQAFNDASQSSFRPYRRFTLLAYLRDCFAEADDNPLVAWLTRLDQRGAAAGGIDKLGALDPLPAASGGSKKGQLHLTLSLLHSAADAQELRELLGQRLRDQTLGTLKEIPLPKFGQTLGDCYQIVPFVRALNDLGKEQIQWAEPDQRSMVFRVAAPFDPNASRPSLIQMPSLSDLKRGLAKGASVITPADTFDLINSLKFDKGASAEALPPDPPPPGLGLQWICSFSLPVITLVAMILLMIMISLLNIVFFWLPWVRICLPFPKLEK